MSVPVHFVMARPDLLVGIVRVVPCSTKLGAEECVGSALARRKRALRNSISTVHCVGLPLAQTMPMHAGTIDLQTVLDGDLKSVSPVCADGWSWILAIDSHHQTLDAVRSHVRPVLDL